MKLGKSQLVEAYEMKKSGMRMKAIARHFDVTPTRLSQKICKCERIGLGWLR